jgi:hypothetical protein
MVRFRLADRASAETIDWPNLGYADAYVGSFEVFDRLQQEGTIPAAVRVQVQYPTPLASMAGTIVAVGAAMDHAVEAVRLDPAALRGSTRQRGSANSSGCQSAVVIGRVADPVGQWTPNPAKALALVAELAVVLAHEVAVPLVPIGVLVELRGALDLVLAADDVGFPVAAVEPADRARWQHHLATKDPGPGIHDHIA